MAQRSRWAGLSVLLFSGYTREAIEQQPHGAAILATTDVLLAGPYCRNLPVERGLLASANQQIHFLTSRYGPADFEDLPRGEIILHRDGSITLSGITPVTRRA